MLGVMKELRGLLGGLVPGVKKELREGLLGGIGGGSFDNWGFLVGGAGFDDDCGREDDDDDGGGGSGGCLENEDCGGLGMEEAVDGCGDGGLSCFSCVVEAVETGESLLLKCCCLSCCCSLTCCSFGVCCFSCCCNLVTLEGG